MGHLTRRGLDRLGLAQEGLLGRLAVAHSCLVHLLELAGNLNHSSEEFFWGLGLGETCKGNGSLGRDCEKRRGGLLRSLRARRAET